MYGSVHVCIGTILELCIMDLEHALAGNGYGSVMNGLIHSLIWIWIMFGLEQFWNYALWIGACFSWYMGMDQIWMDWYIS